MAEAVGILEVFGLATAFVAADAGCKAANVRLEVFDKNKPGEYPARCFAMNMAKSRDMQGKMLSP